MKELSKMIKNDKIKDKLLVNFNKALEEDEFKTFVELLGLTYEELSKYTSILQDSKVEYYNCQKCKSILECKNKVTGYAYLPEVKDKNITFCYKKCRYKIDLDKKNKYLDNVYTFDVPEDIRYADIKDIYKTDKNRHKVIKYIGIFIKEYQKDKKQKGLYLHGNFGCGKTYLVSAMLNELAKKDINSVIIHWPEYLRILKSSFGYKDKSEFKESYERVKEASILLIDDIGAENVTPWSRDEILCSILQYRMEEHLPTFFTSNLDLNALESHLANSTTGSSEIKARRIIERIKQMTVTEEMISKNLRN